MSSKPVFVVASGWSAGQLPLQCLSKYGFVIGVNDSALCMPVHVAVTMDRLWMEHRMAALDEKGIPCWYREGSVKSVKPGPNHRPFKCDNSGGPMSKDPEQLNGSNSGACAMNLAFHMNPEVVYLMGFDMQDGPNGERHWYPPYPWKSGGGPKPATMKGWAQQFITAARQFEVRRVRVVNVSERSLIAAFDKMSHAEFSRRFV